MTPGASESVSRALDPIEFERLITDLSARFVEVDASRVDECIEDALRIVVQALDLDRATVTRLMEEGRGFEATHSWAVAALEPVAPSRPIAGQLAWGADRLRAGDIVFFSSPEELPPEAEGTADWFRAQGVRSHATIPMVVGGEVIGGFHVASIRRVVTWRPLLPRLQTLARIFAASLERQRMNDELRRTLEELRELQRRTSAENVVLKERLESQRPPQQIVGDSPVLRASIDRAEKVARTDTSVLILGETGTGKGLLAAELHRRSRRARNPLVDIDCASLPPTLIESELFGYEKGAFSGATSLKRGRLELAHTGTLVLDEIGELPDELQAKFLRVLETGEVSRLGSTRTREVDVRVIAATNRDLQREVAAGRFRADLYYRISVFPIVMPPLRERSGDVPLLTWFFVERLQNRFGREISRISEATMSALESYAWPGNVRELRNVIERSLILGTGDELQVEDLVRAEPVTAVPTTEDLRTHERDHIRRVLEACRGRIKGKGGAAERLGLKPSTLYYRLKKLGIER